MKKKNALLLIPAAAALVLEMLPYGAVCNFGYPAADGTMQYRRSLYAYFDLLPFGYGNFAPFLTGILTCAGLGLVLAFCLTGKRRLLGPAKIPLGVGVLVSLGPLLLGIEYFSAVGGFITAALLAAFLLVHFTLKRLKEDAK